MTYFCFSIYQHIRPYLSYLCFIFIICFSIQIEIAQAQSTEIYTEEYRDFEEAMTFFDLGNYSLAQKKFGDFLEISKHNFVPELAIRRSEAKYYKALAAKKLNHPNAEMLLLQFLEQEETSPHMSQAYFHLGQLFFAKRHYRDVIDAYARVEPSQLSEEEYDEYYFQYAYSYFTSKRFGKAQNMFTRIINNFNEYYFDANYYYGIIAFFQKDYQTALGSFKRIERNKRYGRAIPYYIAYIYYIQQQPDQLLSYAIPRSKDRTVRYQKEINELIGQTYFNQQKYGEALPYLEYYVDRSSKVRKEDIYQLAFTQYRLGLYTKAIKNFEQLNALKDLMGQTATYHLADCYLKIGQKDKARNAFRVASRMNFDQVIREVASFNFAKLSYELGLQSEAISSLQSFINVYSNSEFGVEARRLLSNLFETTQNYKDALATLESIPNKSPELLRTYQRVLYYRGVEFLGDRNSNQAVNLFNKALDVPQDPEITALCHFWKGDIAYKRRDFPNTFASMEAFLGTARGRNVTEDATPVNANYTIGYSLFKQRDYADARTYFDKIINALSGNRGLLQSNSKVGQVYSDALLRSADCNFMTRKYADASGKYDQVIQANSRGADYAYYQKGILQGLLGNFSAKVTNLSNLLQKFPNSYYTDDALYQIALTQVALQDYPSAIQTHERLISSYPQSEYVPKSMANLGLIHFNVDNLDRSLFYYEKVLRQYPNSLEAQDALLGVKDVFISRGDADGYLKFARKFPHINVSVNAQDSISYQIAENYYNNGDCDKAVPAFSDYLRNFSRGSFILYAHYYRGQCLYSQQKYVEAGRDYDYIINQPRNFFTENALDKGARVAMYVHQDYRKAFDIYKKLYEITSRRDLALEALRGLTTSAYQLNREDALNQFSDLLLQSENSAPEDVVDVYYYRGMMAYKKGNFPPAVSNFSEVVKRTTNEQGAQARYYTAEIKFKNGRLEEANDWAFKCINETAGQEYWVVKSFLLLADVYRAQGELFQAKATLLGLIENYEKEDDLKQEARKKLDILIAEEEAASKIAETDSLQNDYLEFQEEGEGAEIPVNQPVILPNAPQQNQLQPQSQPQQVRPFNPQPQSMPVPNVNPNATQPQPQQPPPPQPQQPRTFSPNKGTVKGTVKGKIKP